MAVNENVNIKVSTDMAQAIQGWKEIADGPLALENALKRVKDLESQTSRGLAREMDNIIGKWTTIGTVIEQAAEQLQNYFRIRQQLREESVSATRDIDVASRQYFISAGIRPGTPRAAEAMQRIGEMATTAAEQPGEAFAAARLLAEFGATSEQQQGAALREMLDLKDVTDIAGRGDSEEVQRRVLEILRRSGRPITGENIRQLGGTAVQLIAAGTGFNVSQLEEFSRVGRVATQAGVEMPTALAMWAALREEEGEMRRARTQYRALFDKDVKPEEKATLDRLRGRARDLLGADRGLPYEEAIEVASQSQVEREQAAETGYQLSGFRPGIVGTERARQAMIDVIRREYGIVAWREQLAGIGFQFQNLLTNDPVRGAMGGVAAQMSLPAARERMERGLRIRLTAPDGRDIPHEVDAVGIQER